MVDFAGMRKSLLASFGEPVTVTVGGLNYPLTAAYLESYTGVDVGGVAINRPDTQFVVESAPWSAINPAPGDAIARANGDVFTVVDPQPADDGMTVVHARRFQ